MRYAAALLMTAMLLVGCGGEPESTTVEGKVTFSGQPVVGLINFQPPQGKPLGGEVNADGSYKFQLPPGEYKVRIQPDMSQTGPKEGEPVSQAAAPAKVIQPILPPKYAGFDTSELKATIGAESPQQLDFTLP